MEKNPANGQIPAIDKRRNQECRVRHRHLLRQPAHLPDVVGMHGMDHRARAKEQQRLEEGVREQVEHRRRIAERSCTVATPSASII